eukprot:jgi/Mesvir1/13310/Mv08913-RA.1
MTITHALLLLRCFSLPDVLQARHKELKAKENHPLGSYSIGSTLGGMRGMSALVWDVSNLDAEEVSDRQRGVGCFLNRGIGGWDGVACWCGMRSTWMSRRVSGSGVTPSPSYKPSCRPQCLGGSRFQRAFFGYS